MMKHLFYSLLITFLLLALTEFIRPGFAVLFLDTRWIFILLIISGLGSMIFSKKERGWPST